MQRGIDYVGLQISFLCHDGNGRYLISRRTDKCRDEHWCWDNGGGGVDVGDTLEETLKKELLEEFGVEPIEHEELGFREVFREGGGPKTHCLAFYYRVLVDPKKVELKEPEKIDKLLWLPIDEIEKREDLHSQLPAVIKRYRDRL